MICGVLNLHKPAGMTSRRVVDVVARLVRPARAGHAGTLDPLASGVLVVCVGRATRLMSYVQQMRKQYRACFLLGRSSPTDDVEGEVQMLASPPVPSREDVERACAVQWGEILQRPPVFSAIKVQGHRAYRLARAGETVELAARPVHVYRLEICRYDYPELELAIECSAGTYVRALGRDVAEALGTAAVMSSLVRTAVGPFTLADAVPLESLRPETLSQILRPPRDAVAMLPRVQLTPQQIQRIQHGQAVQLADCPQGELAACNPAGELVAVLRPAGQMWRAHICLVG